MLEIKNVSHTFGKNVRLNFPDIEVGYNDSLLILGPSGSGKTTLLHILGGLLKPEQGAVKVAGEAIYNLSAGKLDAFRGDHIGVVFQTPHFIPSITAYENIVLTQRVGTGKIHNGFIDSMFDRLHISHRKSAKPNELSQGEKQRLAIIRAFINGPKIVLADELTSALDDKNCESVISLLKEQSERNSTSLIMVTHDQRLKDHMEHSITLENWMT